jgi:tetratricopeptide (TPR) repeat protein
MGYPEKSLANATEAMRLSPNDRFAFANLADAYESLGRYDEAKTVIEQATAKGLGSPTDAFSLYSMAFVRGDKVEMERAVELGKGSSVEPIMLIIVAQGQCSLGRIQRARQTFAEGISSAQKSGLKELSAAIRLVESACLAEVGNPAIARLGAAQALASSTDRDTRRDAADVLARAGDASGSQKLIDALAKEFPADTLLNSVWLPVARATNQIRADQAGQAVETLEVSAPYEFGGPPFGALYWPMYVRGEAYLRLHNGAKAATEYQKILDHQGIATSPLYSLARLGLGRAYVLQNNIVKAKPAYQDFLANWKDADPDVPILKDAKAEYAKLQ